MADNPEMNTNLGGTLPAKGSDNRIDELGNTISANTEQEQVVLQQNFVEGESLADLEIENELNEG